MADSRGDVTYSLLRACRARKDNRLLPVGWSGDHPDAAATRPAGTDGDEDFRAAGDVVDYAIDLPAGAARPLRIEATLHYQTLGARYAAELFRFATPEIRALREYLRRSEHPPEVISRATGSVE
jgi:hypothetical protein